MPIIVGRRLLVLVFGQLLIQVTLALAAAFGLIAVHAKVFGDIFLVDPVIGNNAQFAEGLPQHSQEDRYRKKVFQLIQR